MKTFTKCSLIAAGIAAAASSLLAAEAFSKSGSAREGRRERPALRALVRRQAIKKQVARKLDLSGEQKAQLKAGRSELRDSLKAIRSDASLTTEQKKAKAREVLQAKRSELRGALTEAQKEKLTELRRKIRDRLDKN